MESGLESGSFSPILFRYLLTGSLLLSVPAFRSAEAHCPGSPPKVEMEYPGDGVSIQTACYADFGSCFVDTFYREKLLQELDLRFQASRYAVLAYVDSISNFLVYDTTFYRGQPYYVDTLQAEKVWISIQANLKDSLPVTRLSYIDRWVAFTGNPYATTYSPLIDTPFVAMFTDYDNIRQIGVGPMDGCFFEPTAFTITEGRIRKKGLVGERMPGVSVAWEDFIRKLSLPPLAIPPVREKHVGLAEGRPARAGARRGMDGRKEAASAYDALGRKLEAGPNPVWQMPAMGTGIPEPGSK
jgi:hypothetical protein